MNYIEEKLSIIRNDDVTIYKNFLKSFVHIYDYDITGSDAYKSYLNIVYLIYNELKLKYKTSCLENHFLDRSELNWIEYKESKITYFITSMNEDLEMSYTSNLVIPLDDLLKFYKENFRNKLSEYLDSIFEGCKEVSAYVEKEISALQGNLKDYKQTVANINKPFKNILEQESEEDIMEELLKLKI